MDIYKKRWTTLQSEIFSLMCVKSGDKMSQREIAKYLKVSPTAIANSLDLLEKENLIKVEKNRSMNLISLNPNERKVADLKRVENLKSIYISGFCYFLEELFPGCTIILFGSYSRGEDTVKSDVDIAIIGTKGKKIEFEEFEKKLNREIIINYYPSFKEIHKHLRDSVLSGILLLGSVDL